MKLAHRLRAYVEAFVIMSMLKILPFENIGDYTSFTALNNNKMAETGTANTASSSVSKTNAFLNNPLVNNSSNTTTTGAIDRALGDGCYHIFIDAGSNRGVHGRFLFEPEKYNQSRFIPKFDEIYGPDRPLQNVCVFAFEPNDRHRGPQTATQEAYKKMGWRYHYMPYGVSDEDTQLTFYRNQDYVDGSTHEEWGFATSLLGSKENAITVLINVIDLAVWSEKHIFNRTIPEKNQYNIYPPRVAMKMDIEGLEFKVLYHMDELGTTCKFDNILGERHFNEFPQVFGPYNLSSRGDMRRYGRRMINRMSKEKGCPAFVEFDEEAYLHDGIPYPEPN